MTERDEVIGLARLILYHRNMYYRGMPQISDADYDGLEDRLRRLDPEHPILAEVGAPNVGSEHLLQPVAPGDQPRDCAADAGHAPV